MKKIIISILVLFTIFSFVSAINAVFCPAVYQPVCAVNPAGQIKTYSNDCWAKVDNAIILYQGRCKNNITTPTPVQPTPPKIVKPQF